MYICNNPWRSELDRQHGLLNNFMSILRATAFPNTTKKDECYEKSFLGSLLQRFLFIILASLHPALGSAFLTLRSTYVQKIHKIILPCV